MDEVIKVIVSNGEKHKETECEFFVGLMMSHDEKGFSADHITAGSTTADGVITAIRMIRKMEKLLFGLLPVPREIIEIALKVEDEMNELSSKNSSEKRLACEPGSVEELLRQIFDGQKDSDPKKTKPS